MRLLLKHLIALDIFLLLSVFLSWVSLPKDVDEGSGSLMAPGLERAPARFLSLSSGGLVLLETCPGLASATCLRTLSRHLANNRKLVAVQLDSNRICDDESVEGGVLLDYWTNREGSIPPPSTILLDVAAAAKDAEDACVAVVDSVTPLILAHGVYGTSRLLSAILSHSETVVAVCLGGCHEKSQLEALRGIAQTSIRLEEREEHEEGGLLARTVRRTASGRTEVSRETVDVVAGKVRARSADARGRQLAQKETQEGEESAEDAISRMTTFNLGLTQKEREAKEKLVLPFFKEEQKVLEEEEEEGVRIQSGRAKETSGMIYYSPEDVDDWDDEDPDDDLDF